MANFSQALNTDLNGKLTTAIYDASIAGWVQKIQTHVLSSGGILVPLQLNASGNMKTAISEALPVGNNNIGDVDVASCALPVGAATAAKQDTLIAKDFATQTTLAAILAKIIATPATEAKQDTLIAKDFATQTTLAAVLAKIIAAPATEAKQDTLIAKDFATQTTLAAILAKMIVAPATEATLESVRALLAGTLTTALPVGAATQATLAEILTQLNTTGLKKIIDPLPVGANIIGKTVPVDADGDEKFTEVNPAFTRLTSSIVKVVLVNSVAIATTDTYIGDTIDISHMPHINLKVFSTLDQQVKLGIQVNKMDNESSPAYLHRWNGTVFETVNPDSSILSIANGVIYDINSRLPELNSSKISKIRIIAICDVAPTSGSLDVWIEGSVS